MEETDSKVRRTRSGKIKSTPPAKVTKAAKNSPKTDAKPAGRKTRKKVVLMEVEVSDDEDETVVEISGDEKSEITESEIEDKLLASPEASNDASDVKATGNKDKGELNGADNVSEEKSILNESFEVVFNDIDMLQSDEGEQIILPTEEKEVENVHNKEKTDQCKLEKPTEKPECSLTQSSQKDVLEKPEKTEVVDKTPAESTEVKETEKGGDKKSATLVVAIEKTVETEKKIEVEKEKAEVEKEKEVEKVKVETETKKVEIGKEKTSVVKEKDVEKEKVESKKVEVEKKKVEAQGEKSEVVKEKAEVVKEKVEVEQELGKTEVVTEKQEVEQKKPEVLKDKAEVEKTKTTEKKVEVVEEKDKVVEKKAEVVEKTSEVVEKTSELVEKTSEVVEKTSEVVEKNAEVVVKKAEVEKEKLKEKVDDTKEKVTEQKKVDDCEKMEVDESESDNKASTETDEKMEVYVNEPTVSTNAEKKEESKTGKAEEHDKKTDANEEATEKETEKVEQTSSKPPKQNGDPDAENISEDELPGVPVVKVPEAEEVSDEELPGPKRAELPADTEVVSEDELPTVKSEVKKEGTKRKINESDDYDPGSPTSESEAPAKKPALEKEVTEKEEKPKPKKLPELDKYWKAVNDDPTDFTGWTYLLQYVDQENDMEAAREAYDAFLSHYPYCYGYWRKYADYEKRKGNKKKCEEVFERGLKAIPLSVDLWIHYLTYVKTTRTDEEDFVRSQFDRALAACGLEFRSDRMWDSYIKWETEGKRLQKVTGIYDKLLATPTQGYTTHFDNFQEHVASNPPNKVIDVDEFLALRKEVRNALKHDNPPEATDSDAPPGDEDQSKMASSDEETKAIRERIVSIRRKIHKGTVNAVTARWNYEEGIKRPYFHVKPLERCQLKNWHDYLDYETEQGDRTRIIVLFERCLIACALYEEFWMKFVHYLESLKDAELQPKIRDVYERACTIHHLKKPNLHLQWAMFEENINNLSRAAEILVNLEKTVPNVLQIAYRRINLERRRGDHEKCSQLYEHYINNSKNKMISSNIAIKYSRFCFRILKDVTKAQEVLKMAITKDPNNPRLYLQLIDLTLQKDEVSEKEVIEIIDSFLEKESTEVEQKTLFAQRKLEYLEDFGSDIQSVQVAYENYQKLLKMTKDNIKKKEIKSETSSSTTKKEKPAATSSTQASTYNYGQYGANASQPPYGYSGQQGQYNYSQYGQGEQYQYQNWQYPQGGYGGYNQWGGYGGGYGY